MGRSTARQCFNMLLLGPIGIYGLMAYSETRRTQEMAAKRRPQTGVAPFYQLIRVLA
jgi:hypothetical protein